MGIGTDKQREGEKQNSVGTPLTIALAWRAYIRCVRAYVRACVCEVEFATNYVISARGVFDCVFFF